MTRKIIFFDIDGTIVTDAAQGAKREIPKSAVNAIVRARQNGHLCFINSGRPYGNIDKDVLDIGFDGVISGCGTRIRAGGKEIYSATVPRDICEFVRDECARCRLNGFFEGDSKNYFISCGPNDGWIFDFITSVRQNGGVVSLNTDDAGFGFDKMCVFDDSESDIDSFLKNTGRYFTVIDRGNHFHELIPRGCSKGHAMRIAAQFYNVPMSDTYAVGDSENDVDMFNATPNSIGMGNGVSIHKYVSFVTKDILDNGIEFALRHFNII